MQNMFSHLWTGSLSAAIGLCASIAIADEPVILLHEDISWRAMGDSGMEMAVLTGDPATAAPYSFMIKVPQGTRIPPHSHPDVWRHSTIISGTLLWAFGDAFDEAEMMTLTPRQLLDRTLRRQPLRMGAEQ